MLRSWKLGTAFGIGVYLHWSFWLLVAWVLLMNLSVGGPALAVYGVGLLFAVFGCVVLHELGHALTARHFGIGTRDITLYPIGGVARLDRMSERPVEEFWIAIAGPAVNVVIAVLLAVLLVLTGQLAGPSALSQLMRGNFLLDLMAVNILLVLFNLVPAFPMDGGRVLRALLSMVVGRLPATEAAAALGTVFASGFCLWGLAAAFGLVSFGSPMLLLVGAFVYFAGQQELAAVRQREANRHLPPIDVVPAVAPIPESSEALRGFSGVVWDARLRAWVLWHNGRPVHAYYAE